MSIWRWLLWLVLRLVWRSLVTPPMAGGWRPLSGARGYQAWGARPAAIQLPPTPGATAPRSTVPPGHPLAGMPYDPHVVPPPPRDLLTGRPLEVKA